MDFKFDLFKWLQSWLTAQKAFYIIILSAAVVFANSLFNNFVWDDKVFILNKVAIFPIQDTLKNIFHDPQAYYYRPIPNVFYNFIHLISGDNTFLYHLIQLTLHAINTIIFYLIIKDIFKSTLALFLSLIFLIHPINVESVVYISVLQQILSMSFGLIALYIAKKKVITIKSLSVIFILLMLSAMSKENGVLFSLMIILYLYLIKEEKVKKIVFSILAVVPIYLLLRFIDGKTVNPYISYIPIANASLATRIINIPKIILYYLQTFFFPKDLVISQHWLVQSINFNDFYLPLIILIFTAITLAGIYFLSKKEIFVFVFFLVWFVVYMAPNLQIIPLSMTVADRWFYFPMIGILGIIGIYLQKVKLKNIYLKNITFILALLILTTLSIRTIIRNADWYDAVTLYSHDIKYNLDNFNIYNLLGYEYLLIYQYDQAKSYLDTSVANRPTWWENWSNLGVAYEGKKDIDKSIESFDKSINNNKNYNMAYLNGALIRFHYKSPDDTKDFLVNKALKDHPESSDLWYLLALTDQKLGDNKNALEAATKAYNLNPNNNTQNLYFDLLNNI